MGNYENRAEGVLRCRASDHGCRTEKAALPGTSEKGLKTGILYEKKCRFKLTLHFG
jgi:hypothetical protein